MSRRRASSSARPATSAGAAPVRGVRGILRRKPWIRHFRPGLDVRGPPGPPPERPLAAGRRQAGGGDDTEASIEVDLRDAVLAPSARSRSAGPPDARNAREAAHGPEAGRRPVRNAEGRARSAWAACSAPPARAAREKGPSASPARVAAAKERSRKRPPQVKIPPGVETGSRVRLPGQGGPGPRGGEPGDLYLRITVREHPTVRVQGRDLLSTCPSRPPRRSRAPR